MGVEMTDEVTIYGLEMRFEGGEMVEAEAAYVDWYGDFPAIMEVLTEFARLGQKAGEAFAEMLRTGAGLIRIPP